MDGKMFTVTLIIGMYNNNRNSTQMVMANGQDFTCAQRTHGLQTSWYKMMNPERWALSASGSIVEMSFTHTQDRTLKLKAFQATNTGHGSHG